MQFNDLFYQWRPKSVVFSSASEVANDQTSMKNNPKKLVPNSVVKADQPLMILTRHIVRSEHVAATGFSSGGIVD